MSIRKFLVALADVMGPQIGGYIAAFRADIEEYGHKPTGRGRWQTESSYVMDLQKQLLGILIEELFKEEK